MADEKSDKATCPICPHRCKLSPGAIGICGARQNVNGAVISQNYGRVTSIALDPVEKKPLARFVPGSLLLSVGSYGCNMHCPFCQNASISTAGAEDVTWEEVTPEDLVKHALLVRVKNPDTIGIAYTYNEPFCGYEFVYDCARLAHAAELVNVVVTNGMVCKKPLEKALPFIDALNIDLKSFDADTYRSWGGDLDTVKQTIEVASSAAHVEVTTLVIPGANDSDEEIDAISSWLASVSPDITYHLSRFFPCHRMTDREPTPVKRIYALADVARAHLDHVYTGNC